MKLNEQKSLLLSLMLAVMTTAAWAGEGFKVVQSARQIPERGEVKSITLTGGNLNASVILPHNWRLGNGSDKLVLQSQDFGARIEVRRTTKPSDAGFGDAGSATTILREFALATPAGKTQVVDSQKSVEGNLRINSRTIFITHGDETLEISMSATPAQFSKHQKLLENFIASLRFG